jgi:CBS domain-containing protein
VIVRHSPLKAFQTMLPPVALGPHLRAADAVAVMEHPVIPVVDDGVVLGVVRDATLARLGGDEEIGTIVEDAPLVGVLEAAEAVDEVAEFYDGSPIPLVDARGKLVGMAPGRGRRFRV